jgi:hypothetical protein
MRTEALKLRPGINRIERLLGHNLALTDQVLLDHVRMKIDERETQLGLTEIKLDHDRVDWGGLIHAASYRIAPFQTGETEKGFRDAVIAESFLQLVADSPKNPKSCRVALVTGDQLLSQAVKERLAGPSNASVLSSVEELKGLINTLVSNVSEEFIATLKPKAAKLFFVSADDKDTLYYKEKVYEKLAEKFKGQLEARPEATTWRNNGTWHLSRPNFLRKEGRRIFWTSRIEIEVEAGTVTEKQQPIEISSGLYGGAPPSQKATSPFTVQGKEPDYYTKLWSAFAKDWDPKSGYLGYLGSLTGQTSQERMVTHKGRDIYEVLWSTEVTMSKELKKGVIGELKHIELKCEPILTAR